MKQMHAGVYAPGTIKTRVDNIRAAVRDRLIAADPSLGVTLPRMRKADMAMRIPTPEEVAAIMSVARGMVPTLHRVLRVRGSAPR